MTIKEKINRYSEFKSQVDVLNLAKKEAIDSIMTDEQKAQIEAIELEFEGKAEVANENIKTLTTEIKAIVLQVGETIKGDFHMFAFGKGRKKLDPAAYGYLKAQGVHDEYVSFGNPSVSVRVVK